MSDDEKRFAPFKRNDVAVFSSWYELLKTCIMTPFFPLRVVATVILLAMNTFLVMLGSIGLDNDHVHETYLVWWRLLFLRAGVFLCRLSWLISLGCWPVLSGDMSMHNKQGEKAQIIVSNHCSYMDVNAIMATVFPTPGFVAKSSIFSLPLIGRCARVWGCVPVDRDKKTGASVVDQLQQRCRHPEMNQVVVFPEGTTSNGHYLLHFHKGAFAPGRCVKPLVISYPHRYFSPTWESATAPYHLFRFLTQFVNYCNLELLPVYTPSAAEVANPDLFAQNVRAVMAKASGLKTSESELKDKREYLEILRKTKDTLA